MELFEYQAKSFLSRFGLPYPPYFFVFHEQELAAAFTKYGLTKGSVQLEWIDAQGKKGVQAAPYDSLESFVNVATTLLQKKSSTQDRFFSEVLVRPFVDIDQEIALSITCSTKTGRIDIEVSTMYLGEKRVLKESVLRNRKLYEFQKNGLFVGLHLPERLREPFFAIVDGLIALYYTHDVVSLYVRPLAVLYNGGLIIANLLIDVDDNAFFRQPEVRYFVEKRQLPSLFHEASTSFFTYQEYPGSIGCLVTGQALVQATVDLLYVYGGHPGLAINIGEEIDENKLTRALDSFLVDTKTRVILLNLFVGFKNCEPLMEALVKLLREKSSQIPIVVRLSALSLNGVHELLAHSHLHIQCTESLEEAIRWSVAQQGGEKHAHSS